MSSRAWRTTYAPPARVSKAISAVINRLSRSLSVLPTAGNRSRRRGVSTVATVATNHADRSGRRRHDPAHIGIGSPARRAWVYISYIIINIYDYSNVILVLIFGL